MTSQESVVLDVVDGTVLVITINRPAARNSIDAAVATGLLKAVERLDADPTLQVGVITGAGGFFSSGMDLKAFEQHGPPADLMPFLTREGHKPTIAAVERFALAGGLEVALTCDMVVASEGSRFGVPEVSVGLFAAGGALCRLPRRMPISIALEMALTAQPITAENAQTHGLVNRIVPAGEALEGALDLARTIASHAPAALQATRELMYQSLDLDESAFWGLQQPLIATVFGSDDAKEGPRAFAEKRPPNWTGK
ncbi:crotonase/enoyl-CoA hydratase family protein [Rhodococcus sp. MS16]|uniref:crotonase/enoyl-CoA hydratase family protein n=1 Tax=Rhodococcus sp. MS16 TaxID=2579941 RepID=UPI001561C05C|nr:crotonase/enoyl-CoA hydratase family protein [Rhodococcus sp. MS16]NRI70060.1 crotonase/enoyl-CoA hydratase family protein [Rhodococcus sp. MS16]